MENLRRVIQDPRLSLTALQTTCSKGAARRNRCSFVKVSPTESCNTFGNEVNAQFLATIPPMHSVGFHCGLPAHFTLRAVTMETTQRISWWMLHITFYAVSQLRTSTDTIRLTKTRITDCLQKCRQT